MDYQGVSAILGIEQSENPEKRAEDKAKIVQPSNTKIVCSRHPLWLPKVDGQYVSSLEMNVYRHVLLG